MDEGFISKIGNRKIVGVAVVLFLLLCVLLVFTAYYFSRAIVPKEDGRQDERNVYLPESQEITQEKTVTGDGVETKEQVANSYDTSVTKPGKPSIDTLTTVSEDEIGVYWTRYAPLTQSSFEIRVQLQNQASFASLEEWPVFKVVSANTTQEKISGLRCGAMYGFVVVAVAETNAKRYLSDLSNVLYGKTKPCTSATATFQYPSDQISWTQQGGDFYGIKFFLTDVYLGETVAPQKLTKDEGGYYREGETIYALVLTFKIVTPNIPAESIGVDMPLQRLLNESGDFSYPNTRKLIFPDALYGLDGGARLHTTYVDQKIIFVVPPSEKDFYIRVNGDSSFFFQVTAIEQGGLRVQKLQMGG